MTTLSSQDQAAAAETQSRPGFADELLPGMIFSLAATEAASGILSPAGDRITVAGARHVGKQTLVAGTNTDGVPVVQPLDLLRTVLIHKEWSAPGPAVEYETGGTAERAVLIDVIHDLRRLAFVAPELLAERIGMLADRYAQSIADA